MKRGVVFDMDKCIGYFTQMAVYHDIIEELSRPLKVNEYFELFDIFPEIFRPGIFKVFKYLLKEKKKSKLEIVLYTNNNGPPSWATNIRKYIEHKIKKKLFDRTIKGWKYDNKIVEEKRCGYAKSRSDLLKCTKLTKKDKIIFFDDRDEHYRMIHKNIDYQIVKPYRSGIHHEDFVNKFMKSKLNKKLNIEKETLANGCHKSRYRPKLTMMKYSNNDIMRPLREFLKRTNMKKTRRRLRLKNKKTRKRRGGDTACKDGEQLLSWEELMIHNGMIKVYRKQQNEDLSLVPGTYRIEERFGPAHAIGIRRAPHFNLTIHINSQFLNNYDFCGFLNEDGSWNEEEKQGEGFVEVN
jgi:hypothetical protein